MITLMRKIFPFTIKEVGHLTAHTDAILNKNMLLAKKSKLIMSISLDVISTTTVFYKACVSFLYFL